MTGCSAQAVSFPTLFPTFSNQNSNPGSVQVPDGLKALHIHDAPLGNCLAEYPLLPSIEGCRLEIRLEIDFEA
jgi:hypothetical protein